MMNDTFDDFILSGVANFNGNATSTKSTKMKNSENSDFNDSLSLTALEDISTRVNNSLAAKTEEKLCTFNSSSKSTQHTFCNKSSKNSASQKKSHSQKQQISTELDKNHDFEIDSCIFSQSFSNLSLNEDVAIVNENNDAGDLQNLNLPDEILNKYKGKNITKLFPWQIACLSLPGVFESFQNLIYSAPTSAGKTLVSEILAIKTVLERKKKVILILPFVSLVREKLFYFQDIFGTSGVRVEGFMGAYNPPGGFRNIQMAICTIEKANSLINRLLEEGKLSDIGNVIVDELHLLGDSSRGYLLELLLTKLQYVGLKNDEVHIQIVGMSATLSNLHVLGKWINAVVYTTDFRPIPLLEQCLIQRQLFDSNFQILRTLDSLKELKEDTDNVLQLCIETIENNCSVLIFCSSKKWVESLAMQIASSFYQLGSGSSSLGAILRKQLDAKKIAECLEQLKLCPVGLDQLLGKVVSFGVGFHHAGLTLDERDIIEGAFRSGTIRVLVATSTLSSGVNLPARRVIIRSAMFYGKPLDNQTYKQMVGRAGRMGKDSAGESILICQKKEQKIAQELMSAQLKPVTSCLESSGRLKRALLEIIASEVAKTKADLLLFTQCTLLFQEEQTVEFIEDALEFLLKFQFIRYQEKNDVETEGAYFATALAKACLSSSMPPEEGLELFAELEKARQCFVLDSDLHIIYLVTPFSAQISTIDWMHYLELWEKLPTSNKRVGELVGIKITYLINASQGRFSSSKPNAIHKRFYTALALQDLINEVPLNVVAQKYNCNRGALQSLQQSAASFAGMVTAFCRELGWTTVELLVSQFQDRLEFGVCRELLDLMRLPILNGQRARSLYNAGIKCLVDLAGCDVYDLENILHKSKPFESSQKNGESKYEADKRKEMKTFWITGKEGITEFEAAQLIIRDARKYLQFEIGLNEANWSTRKEDSSQIVTNLSFQKSMCLKEDICSTDSSKSMELNKQIINTLNVRTNEISVKIESSSLNSSVDELKLIDQSKIVNKLNDKNLNKSITFLEIPQIKETKSTETADIVINDYLNDSEFDDTFKLPAECEEKKQETDANAILLKQSASNTLQENMEIVSNDVDIKESSNSFYSDSFSDLPNLSKTLEENVSKGTELNKTFVSFKRKQDMESTENIDVAMKEFSDLDSLECDSSLKSDDSIKANNVLNNSDNIIFNDSVLSKAFAMSFNDSIDSDDLFDAPDNNLDVDEEHDDYFTWEQVDVCKSEELFELFLRELQIQNVVSLALACEHHEKPKRVIGLNQQKIIVEENYVHNCVKTTGIALYWPNDFNAVSFIDLNRCTRIMLNKIFNHLSKEATILRIFHCNQHLKLLNYCLEFGPEMINGQIEDPMCADWLLDPSEDERDLLSSVTVYLSDMANVIEMYALKFQSSLKFQSLALDYKSLEGSSEVRACIEALVTFKLMDALKKRLDNENSLFLHCLVLEMKTLHILSKMETSGIQVDLKRLQSLAESLRMHLRSLETKAYNLAGKRFSFTSSTAVAKVLNLNQNHRKKRILVNKQILSANDNPISTLIIQWRKINATFTNMLLPLLRNVQDNGRIHSNCLTHNVTGRITMQEPNIQNVPRTFAFSDPVTGKMHEINCRSCFVASRKHCLVSADYCQLELRILAHFSQDADLCSVVKTENRDIFKLIAAKWLKCDDLNDVSDELRQHAKAICYGVVYGIGTKALAEQMDVGEEEAAEFTDKFHANFPGIRKFVKHVVQECRQKGYVDTVLGRRRFLPDICSENVSERGKAERQAVNTTIQGSAADIAKQAMASIDAMLREKFKNSRNAPKLILQLHDELLYEVPLKYQDVFTKILRKCMQGALKLSVPLPIKVQSGLSWGDLKVKTN